MSTYRTVQGETLDQIAHRLYGATAEVTEQLYDTNPGLADLGPVLPEGTVLRLVARQPRPALRPVRLWGTS